MYNIIYWKYNLISQNTHYMQLHTNNRAKIERGRKDERDRES